MTNHPSLVTTSGRGQWLLVPLLVVLLPFFTACPPDDPEPIEPIDDPPITSVSALVDVVDPQALDGREVRLLNVRVVEVLGDTAFFVADDRMAPAPPPDDPAFPDDPDAPDDAAMDQPMDEPAMDPAPAPTREDRVLVVWHGDLLGDVGAGQQFEDVVRVGANVDVFGQARARDHAAPAAPPADRPRPMDDDAAPMDDDPGAMDRPTTMQPQDMGSVYVEADRVEPHDPARAPTGPADPAAPAPGAPGDADGY